MKDEDITINSMIHVIRGRQVMLDSDLAVLYQVETGALNRAVKRNRCRFPEDFCFRLNEEEFLKCQTGISKTEKSEKRGGRRTTPYAFTEQGISMLSAVLHSDTAVEVSIRIIRAFVDMRHFLAENSLILNHINEIEVRQLSFQRSTDERFEKVFKYIETHAESSQKVFFDGQIYDAYALLTSIVRKANRGIILIDGYVDIDTLNLLAKKDKGVKVTIYTASKTGLTSADVQKFNQQYSGLSVKRTNLFHDRFIIIDEIRTYHIGASVKDAGKKCFAVSEVRDPQLTADLLGRLNSL